MSASSRDGQLGHVSATHSGKHQSAKDARSALRRIRSSPTRLKFESESITEPSHPLRQLARQFGSVRDCHSERDG